MHEKSLVQSLLTQVKAIMLEHGANSVESVTVEIGPLSGVEPLLVEDAFFELLPAIAVGNPTLNVQVIDLTIRCRECQDETSVADLTLQCVKCGSVLVQVIRGDEFRLMDLSLNVPADSKDAQL